MEAPVSSDKSDLDAIATESGAVPSDVLANSLGDYVRMWWARVRSGDSGALPVLVGLAAIVIYFDIRSSAFLSAGNLVNLMTQAAWIVVLGMAEVWVLLLGEIDLSIGYSAVMGAARTIVRRDAGRPAAGRGLAAVSGQCGRA